MTDVSRQVSLRETRVKLVLVAFTVACRLHGGGVTSSSPTWLQSFAEAVGT